MMKTKRMIKLFQLSYRMKKLGYRITKMQRLINEMDKATERYENKVVGINGRT